MPAASRVARCRIHMRPPEAQGLHEPVQGRVPGVNLDRLGASSLRVARSTRGPGREGCVRGGHRSRSSAPVISPSRSQVSAQRVLRRREGEDRRRRWQRDRDLTGSREDAPAVTAPRSLLSEQGLERDQAVLPSAPGPSGPCSAPRSVRQTRGHSHVTEKRTRCRRAFADAFRTPDLRAVPVRLLVQLRMYC